MGECFGCLELKVRFWFEDFVLGARKGNNIWSIVRFNKAMHLQHRKNHFIVKWSASETSHIATASL